MVFVGELANDRQINIGQFFFAQMSINELTFGIAGVMFCSNEHKWRKACPGPANAVESQTPRG